MHYYKCEELVQSNRNKRLVLYIEPWSDSGLGNGFLHSPDYLPGTRRHTEVYYSLTEAETKRSSHLLPLCGPVPSTARNSRCWTGWRPFLRLSCWPRSFPASFWPSGRRTSAEHALITDREQQRSLLRVKTVSRKGGVKVHCEFNSMEEKIELMRFYAPHRDGVWVPLRQTERRWWCTAKKAGKGFSRRDFASGKNLVLVWSFIYPAVQCLLQFSHCFLRLNQSPASAPCSFFAVVFLFVCLWVCLSVCFF